ncbi:MAG TPA: hypothetical protein VHP83_09120 [Aggregatilineaceae bacterium]|nr:hypothetical protein [Aggregatilineaceae bacterium]
MSKRFGLVLIVLLVAPMLLTACGSDSEKAAEDYMEAVLKGEVDKAKEKACADFQDQTEKYTAAYQALTPDIHTKSLDLKFDVGKGQNNEEIIVTGSYEYGDKDNPKEYELVNSYRLDDDEQVALGVDSDHIETRVVLMMKEEDGDWCVSSDSKFNDPVLNRLAGGEVAPAETTDEPAAEATEAPAAEMTAEPEAAATDEPVAEATEEPAADATAEATAEAE